ncbi:MAG: YybS family protein [Alphaproteobacteria bacterium]|nr:YybS family protein [Alphaproteobacteria bacterium]
MQRNLLTAVAAGLASALLALSSSWGILGVLVLTLFAPLPLIAAGLSLGLTAAAIAALTALAVVALVQGVGPLAVFAASDAVPSLMIARFALLNRQAPDGAIEWYPAGRLLTWICFFGVALFVATALIAGLGPDGLQARIAALMAPIREAMPNPGSDTARADADRVFAALKFTVPAILTTAWMFKLVFNGVLAQKILARRGLSLRPSPDLRTLTLPSWLAGVTVAATVVGLLGSGWLGFLGANIALILWVPYLLLGLAVLHTVSGRWPGRTPLLVVTYLFVILFGWLTIALAGVGFLEQWLGLRERFSGPGRGNERKE